MKITIAYIEAEGGRVAATVDAIKQLLPTAKVRESERHPPFKHIYLSAPAKQHEKE